MNDIARVFLYAALSSGLLMLTVKPALADIFYKDVKFGPYCTFEISRFIGKEESDWELSAADKEITVDYESVRYAGKELFLDIRYMKLKLNASVKLAAANTIRQVSSRPGILDFRYECSDYLIPGSAAMTCIMSYKKNRLDMNYQVLFIVPNKDINSAYYFISGYRKPYSKKVVDRLFRSIRIDY